MDRWTMRATSKKIYSERPEIEKQVYEKFPVTKAEKKCLTEKAIMDGLRFNMAKKLYEEEKSKN